MVLKHFIKVLPLNHIPSLDFLSTHLKKVPSGQDVIAGLGLFLSLKQAHGRLLEGWGPIRNPLASLQSDGEPSVPRSAHCPADSWRRCLAT